MKKTQLSLLIAVYILVISMLTLTAGFVWLSRPIDVLNDNTWVVTTDKKQYRVGDKITLEINLDKLYLAPGTSRRYVVCKNSNNLDAQYFINSVPTSKGLGHSSYITSLIFPDSIVKDTPARCHMHFANTYKINIINTRQEVKDSNEFTVSP